VKTQILRSWRSRLIGATVGSLSMLQQCRDIFLSCVLGSQEGSTALYSTTGLVKIGWIGLSLWNICDSLQQTIPLERRDKVAKPVSFYDDSFASENTQSFPHHSMADTKSNR